jgi:excisionase family DNA binding protein
MDRRLQTRMRENAASDGRHGSRFAVSMKSSSNSVGEENGKTLCGTVFADESIAGANFCPHAATQAATAGEESGVDADLKAIRSALAVVERPLTCEEAAALIRAHPKTVKRMARRGDLPGHFRFGRWFFYASELDAWMRTELHSSCHSRR